MSIKGFRFFYYVSDSSSVFCEKFLYFIKGFDKTPWRSNGRGDEAMAHKVECRLKEILSDRGMKQKWLAEQVGVTTSEMSQIVRGESEPTLMTALKISTTLDLIANEIWTLPEG
ncbi:helix-turn-helix transcriptional regulator [Paenibacillus sp. SYP-B4298]|uniref:helix-turn-helix transcriptional regulator n=1 Tax=Paenibacillus sp. SYP-B4298 TaxID=2996034 RepID=UPI0022DD9A13|nr:helix-turn-helix transcriptional regulator [Paenibacillus sp. SYP-B4298]